MNQIVTETEDFLKSVYGDKWRQALLMHLLIGAGQIIADRIRLEDPEQRGKPHDPEQLAEEPEPIAKLEQNPLKYIRSISCVQAKILEFDLEELPSVAIIFSWPRDTRFIGEFIREAGIQALERLKKNWKSKARTFAEELMRRAWREADEGIKEGAQQIVRRLYLISGAYSGR